MAPKPFLVPFDAQGNLQHYARKVHPSFRADDYWRSIEWRERAEFTATLTIDHTISGVSAKYFVWHDEAGHNYPMFATDLTELVKTANINRGTVSGVWYPCKRGQNFGIQFVRDI